MSILSMYNASIPALDRLLGNLDYVLKKGEANAKERGIDPSVFLTARLYPDMAPLTKQVQIAASMSKMCPHRLVGSTPPVYDDAETTFEELYALIAKARKEINSFTPEQINGTETRKFTVKLGPVEREFIGIAYSSGFTIPNVTFHCTTAYNILRHNGVPLGKMDFFGGGNL
ncbi:MAG: DUF1993 domain-containing protein [Alphaproteobacteria bacterium]